MANSIAITIFNNALSATQNKNYEEAAKYYLEAIKYDSEIFKEYNTKIYDYANSLPHNMSYLLLKNVIKKSSPYYQLIFDWIMNNGISHKCKDWRIISNYALGNIYGINNDFVKASSIAFYCSIVPKSFSFQSLTVFYLLFSAELIRYFAGEVEEFLFSLLPADYELGPSFFSLFSHFGPLLFSEVSGFSGSGPKEFCP